MYRKETFKKAGFVFFALLCLSPVMKAPIALLTGFLFTTFFGHPFARHNHKMANYLLKITVVGLGFGMNIDYALKTGERGFGLTVFSICSILLLGVILGRIFKINPRTAHLVSSGTAICGGSAIAAISPIVNASEKDMSVALGTIFALNSVALILFPFIGHLLHLSQYQFGLWSAIAIQDTSSVVGAASAYGKDALMTATTVKLARALWIVPVAVITAYFFKNKGRKISIPWFIGLFILAMLFNSYFNLPKSLVNGITTSSQALMVLTLFLIGAGLSTEKLKQVGWRPLLLGLLLWVFVSSVSLYVIMQL